MTIVSHLTVPHFWQNFVIPAGSSKIEVMLELLLVDAHVTLQRDMLMTTNPSVHASGPAQYTEKGASECDLFVLVSRASNLPELKSPAMSGEEIGSRQPSSFVAAKSSRDIVHGGGVQGATSVVSSSCNPVWCVFLRIKAGKADPMHMLDAFLGWHCN